MSDPTPTPSTPHLFAALVAAHAEVPKFSANGLLLGPRVCRVQVEIQQLVEEGLDLLITGKAFGACWA